MEQIARDQRGVDRFQVNRRPPDFEDYIDIARRHKAWILGPAFLGLVAAVVTAYLWPDTFVSTATIRVIPPLVPERFVPTNVSADLSQRINTMAQEIRSRATLTNVIRTHNLYPRERERLPMEDILEKMNRDLRIATVGRGTGRTGATAFQVSFFYTNRYTAQRVTNELVSKFMDQNLRARAAESVTTTQFLKEQWDQAKQELDEVERKLIAFRVKNSGLSPDQTQMLVQRLTSLESRLGAVMGSINRSSQDKLLMESNLQGLKSQLTAASAPAEETVQAAAAIARNDRAVQMERQLENLRLSLSALRERYKDTHPDVQRLKSQISVLEAEHARLISEEAAQAPAERGAGTVKRQIPANPQAVENLNIAIRRVEAEIQVKDLEMQDLTKEKAQLDAAIKELQAKLNAIPLTEGEYALLLRDRELARRKYDELSQKRSQSELATDLENRKQGETLEVLDPASLPETPTAPKRAMIIFAGLGAGLVLGLSLASVRELKDTSLKNLKDVRAYTQLSILASIPLLENDLVVRRRRRLNWLAWSTTVLVGLSIMGGSVFYYYASRT